MKIETGGDNTSFFKLSTIFQRTKMQIDKVEQRAITHNIRKPGIVGNLNFCTFAQIRNGLISWSYEIPAYAYC